MKEIFFPSNTKTLKVLQHIIKIASNEGDIVLDPFMGIGSTGEAALLLNRRFIGIEVEKKYINGAIKRLEKFEQVKKLPNIIEPYKKPDIRKVEKHPEIF